MTGLHKLYHDLIQSTIDRVNVRKGTSYIIKTHIGYDLSMKPITPFLWVSVYDNPESQEPRRKFRFYPKSKETTNTIKFFELVTEGIW